MLNEYMENSSKQNLGGKTVQKCKGDRAYPEAKHGHGFLSLETPI
jgi:hypothetical protein